MSQYFAVACLEMMLYSYACGRHRLCAHIPAGRSLLYQLQKVTYYTRPRTLQDLHNRENAFKSKHANIANFEIGVYHSPLKPLKSFEL